MEKTTGIIDAVSQKPKNYGIKIGMQWFNGFGNCMYKKGDKVELTWEFNEQYNSNSIKEHKLLEASTETTAHKPKDNTEFRINVDAGNLVQRQIEFLNGCEDLTFKDKIAIIKDKVLIEPLTENFKEAISLLGEKSPQQSVKTEIISDTIPNKEEMQKQLDEMQKEGDKLKETFK